MIKVEELRIGTVLRSRHKDRIVIDIKGTTVLLFHTSYVTNLGWIDEIDFGDILFHRFIKNWVILCD